VLEIAHAGAAIVLFDRDAENAELTPEISWKRIGGIDLSCTRRDLRGRETLDHGAQSIGGFAKPEIEMPKIAGHAQSSVLMHPPFEGSVEPAAHGGELGLTLYF
jgi:hypothetical protein